MDTLLNRDIFGVIEDNIAVLTRHNRNYKLKLFSWKIWWQQNEGVHPKLLQVCDR